MKIPKLKKCIICNQDKPKREFSAIKEAQGLICADCMSKCHRKQFKQAVNEIQKKKVRSYHRRYNQEPEFREKVKANIKRFKEQYPEKAAAWAAIQRFPKIKGCDLHHWSYNELHYTDIITIRKQDHYKIHKYIEYDPQTKMYKDKASGFILNTKSLHAAYISLILEHY